MTNQGKYNDRHMTETIGTRQSPHDNDHAEDERHEKAREIASKIDGILHAGQHAEPRYIKLVPVVAQALRDAVAAETERCAKIIENMGGRRSKLAKMAAALMRGTDD